MDKIRIRFQMFRKHFHVFGNGILKETIKHGINDEQREVGFLSVKVLSIIEISRQGNHIADSQVSRYSNSIL